ncbi:MAG: hypothetical protein Kow0059_13210 [Candidatus Sumerlaeia bacterium]
MMKKSISGFTDGRRRGFTLIELLIVVAIIAILAAIAVPNFLEAQTRAKVSRADADMRTLAVALELYRVDYNHYPPENWLGPELVPILSGVAIPNVIKLKRLTTPIAYVTALPGDPFAPDNDPLNQLWPRTYHYASRNDPLYPGNAFFDGEGDNEEGRRCEWVLQSYGPDHGIDLGLPTYYQFPRYDPTNGTVSLGNILRMGP